MDKPQDPEAAETVQTKEIQAVDLPRLVRLYECRSCGRRFEITGAWKGHPNGPRCACASSQPFGHWRLLSEFESNDQKYIEGQIYPVERGKWMDATEITRPGEWYWTRLGFDDPCPQIVFIALENDGDSAPDFIVECIGEDSRTSKTLKNWKDRGFEFLPVIPPNVTGEPAAGSPTH